jgi:hypothetical protein
VNRGGFCVAGIYSPRVVFVFASTASTPKADNVGYGWIPSILLSIPWYGMNPLFLFPLLIVNGGLMYLLGALFDTLLRRIIEE